MRAVDLDEAISWQNAVDYGLTGGIHSLDPDELDTWLSRVEMGNAYVNRHITGAIVRRQPFGGWKRSVVGPSAKAGGPNTLLTMGRWSPGGRLDVEAAAASLRRWWDREVSRDHDPSGLRAEANVLRYRPLPGGVVLRLGPATAEDERQVAMAGAFTAGVRCVVSSTAEEDDAALAGRLPGLGVDRLRLLVPCGPELLRAAHAAGVTVDDAPVVGHGRVELLHWVREQAISRTRHRYGNVVDDR
jgi:RHH-type proline utilization regulon transcriptional repressor/proline dehydrogenase/delta 1-pyrroline-5-carboxylate dehydrogenase